MADNAISGAAPKRPLSPHLQVWRFTITMAASITQRGAGVALYGGSVLLTLWLFALAANPALFATLSAFARSPFGVVIIAGFVWSLCFHLMNGLRYLYWDSGRGFALKTARMTAWMVYIASVVLAAVILWAGYAAAGSA